MFIRAASRRLLVYLAAPKWLPNIFLTREDVFLLPSYRHIKEIRH